MNKQGAIIVIEDDEDDQHLLKEIFQTLSYPNEVIYFSDGEHALQYLTKTESKPFLILSDINMPKLSGFELREKIYTDAKLNLKCIPYLFFTTASNQRDVINAYSKSVQGFFVKPRTSDKLEITIKKIVEYWQECESPKFNP